MAHPHDSIRQHKVEKSRVSHITRGYASGGGVKHSDEKQDRKLFGKMIAEHDREAEGKGKKHRHDRPHRAKGGRVKGKGATHVNVIVNGGDKHPPMAPPPPMMPPGPPPGPVAGLGGPPPPMPPGAGPGGPGAPPMMPPRARGGRIESPKSMKPYAKGGGVKSGPAWEEGKRLGTHVSHDKAKEPDIKNMDRPRVVTFNAGGKAVSFRARGGRMEAPQGVAEATKNTGGAGGGAGRREKARKYGGKPMKEVDGAR